MRVSSLTKRITFLIIILVISFFILLYNSSEEIKVGDYKLITNFLYTKVKAPTNSKIYLGRLISFDYLEEEKSGYNLTFILKTIKNKFYLTNKNLSLIKSNINNLRPWKVKFIDIDNSGSKKLAVGVNKKTYFDPTYQKRVFMYNIDDGYLTPFFKASRMTGKVIDFSDIKIDNTKYFLALEENEIGNELKRYVRAYKSKGFGFTLIKEKEVNKKGDLEIKNNEIFISNEKIKLNEKKN